MTTIQDKAWQYCVDMNYVHPDDKEKSLECETAIAAYVKGYEQARKDTCRVTRKSPLTGGELLLLQEKANVTFRGESVTFTKKFYHCVDSGMEFTNDELDDDNMWAIFRAYCEKKGIESFKDLILKEHGE